MTTDTRLEIQTKGDSYAITLNTTMTRGELARLLDTLKLTDTNTTTEATTTHHTPTPTPTPIKDETITKNSTVRREGLHPNRDEILNRLKLGPATIRDMLDDAGVECTEENYKWLFNKLHRMRHHNTVSVASVNGKQTYTLTDTPTQQMPTQTPEQTPVKPVVVEPIQKLEPIDDDDVPSDDEINHVLNRVIDETGASTTPRALLKNIQARYDPSVFDMIETIRDAATDYLTG